MTKTKVLITVKTYPTLSKKYDWVELYLDKNKTNFRSESYRPHAHDTAFDIVGHIGTSFSIVLK